MGICLCVNGSHENVKEKLNMKVKATINRIEEAKEYPEQEIGM